MRILWSNVVVFLLAIVAVVVVVKMLPQIAAFLATMREIGPGNDPADQTLGLIAVGLTGVTIVAIVKILTNRRD